MMTRQPQGLGLPSPGDLLRMNPAYYLGQKVGQALTGGGSTQPAPDGTQPSPAGDMTQGGAAGGAAPGMSTTTMILLGAGVVATGIIIYAVATAKPRRR